MVSLLAVLGRHRTLLTSTDSMYSGPTPNHNTRELVLYSVGGGLHAQDSNGEPWWQGPHIAKSSLEAFLRSCSRDVFSALCCDSHSSFARDFL